MSEDRPGYDDWLRKYHERDDEYIDGLYEQEAKNDRKNKERISKEEIYETLDNLREIWPDSMIEWIKDNTVLDWKRAEHEKNISPECRVCIGYARGECNGDINPCERYER